MPLKKSDKILQSTHTGLALARAKIQLKSHPCHQNPCLSAQNLHPAKFWYCCHCSLCKPYMLHYSNGKLQRNAVEAQMTLFMFTSCLHINTVPLVCAPPPFARSSFFPLDSKNAVLTRWINPPPPHKLFTVPLIKVILILRIKQLVATAVPVPFAAQQKAQMYSDISTIVSGLKQQCSRWCETLRSSISCAPEHRLMAAHAGPPTG